MFPRSWARYERYANRIALRLVGLGRAYARLEHVGRKSGKVRHTPVRAFRDGDSILVGLNHGHDTDWCRNIMAAGGCKVRLGAEAYECVAPRIVPAGACWRRIPPAMRFALRYIVHTEEFLELSITTVTVVGRTG